ncbi:MAG: hypothetical protein NC916_02945, partial [Candidatus Omnitrophica bacterium]|nr:hypothetical protein [Candidatus Omnitrophota bacterium]
DFALGLHKFYQRLEKADLRDIQFIKCHITGPFSFAAGINDEKGVSLLYDKVYMQAIIKGLSLKALWQLKLFRKFNKKRMLFVDEPYLGSFGSAYTPLNREEVVESLSNLTEPIALGGALVGIHCCGNTDWSIFTEVKGIRLISFDAFSFLNRLILYADSLKEFFARGGMLCWGIVPTQEFSGKETAELLSDKLLKGIDTLVSKGLSRESVTNNLFISPACGLGTLEIKKAEQIIYLTNKLKNYIIDNL